MIRTLLAVLALASLLSADIIAPIPTSVTGVLKKAPSISPGIICPPGPYTLECSEGLISLRSDSINLEEFLGQNVKMTIVNTGKACPTFEVLDIDITPPATLTRCGTAEGLGCPFRLRSGPGGISQHFLLISLSPGFFPQGIETGAFLLGSPFLVLTSKSGAFPPEGAAFDFVMPSDFSLIGLDIHFQAVRRDVGPVGPAQFSNSVCITPIGIPILCVEPDC